MKWTDHPKKSTSLPKQLFSRTRATLLLPSSSPNILPNNIRMLLKDRTMLLFRNTRGIIMATGTTNLMRLNSKRPLLSRNTTTIWPHLCSVTIRHLPNLTFRFPNGVFLKSRGLLFRPLRHRFLNGIHLGGRGRLIRRRIITTSQYNIRLHVSTNARHRRRGRLRGAILRRHYARLNTLLQRRRRLPNGIFRRRVSLTIQTRDRLPRKRRIRTFFGINVYIQGLHRHLKKRLRPGGFRQTMDANMFRSTTLAKLRSSRVLLLYKRRRLTTPRRATTPRSRGRVVVHTKVGFPSNTLLGGVALNYVVRRGILRRAIVYGELLCAARGCGYCGYVVRRFTVIFGRFLSVC